MKTSKASSQARDTQIIAGIAEHLAANATITLGGVDYKAKQIQRLLQDRIAAASATAAARAKWLTAAAAEEEKTTTVESLLLALRSYLITAHGAKSQIVADFGFTPKKRQRAAADTVAAAVVKRSATRKARGTVSKKEKEKVTGATEAAAVPAPAEATAAPAVNGAAPGVAPGH